MDDATTLHFWQPERNEVGVMAEGNIGGTAISDLPPSSFAYCEPGTEAVSTRCHFPIRDKSGKADAAHVRNALARLSGSPFEAKARAKVEAAAKELGIGESKAEPEPMKAEPMTERQMTRWLSGDISRRILVLPFGGSIPSPKSPIGVDLDDEWFDAETDIYGTYPALKASRRRVVDWHHNDRILPAPPVSMRGRTLGEINLDEESEEDGLWADWWTKVGEENMRRVALMEKRGVPLFGSTQAVPGGERIAPSGHIDVWPFYRHTITTAPINRRAAVPPLKAVLDALTTSDLSSEAMKAVLVGLDALEAELTQNSAGLDMPGEGDGAAKSGRVLSGRNETAIRARLAELRASVDAFEQFVDEQVRREELEIST